MEFVLVSANPQKVLQIRAILKELMPKGSLRSLFDFPTYTPAESSPSQTLAERARFKALDAAKTLKLPALAEQWELVIPSLDLKPIFSQHATVGAQTRSILEKLQGKSELQRAAYLESAVAWALPEGKVFHAVARVEGQIAESERGKGSLDFENIFIKYDYVKTLAELGQSVKTRISHHCKALEKLLIYVEGR